MHFREHTHFLREARFRFTVCGTKSYSVEIVAVCLPFRYSFTISFELNNFAGKLACASTLTRHGSRSEASIATGSCKHHFGLLSVYFLLPTYLLPFQTEKENHLENCMAEVETLRVLLIFDVVGWVKITQVFLIHHIGPLVVKTVPQFPHLR